MQDPLGDCRTVNMEALDKIKKAKELDLKGEFEQAKTIGKAVAFDALRTQDYDLLRQSYLLLASMEDDQDQMFAYIQCVYTKKSKYYCLPRIKTITESLGILHAATQRCRLGTHILWKLIWK